MNEIALKGVVRCNLNVYHQLRSAWLSACVTLMDVFPPDDGEQRGHSIYCLLNQIAVIIRGFSVNMLAFT